MWISPKRGFTFLCLSPGWLAQAVTARRDLKLEDQIPRSFGTVRDCHSGVSAAGSLPGERLG
jgi:hypothetical protein